MRDARPSTEWLDTVELGANTLVDDDPERLAEAVREALPLPPDRRSTATGMQLVGSRRRSVRFSADRAHRRAAPSRWDVAVVGAGYVGVPLAQVFADAGRRVLLVDVVGASSTG